MRFRENTKHTLSLMSNIITLSPELSEYKIDERELDNVKDDVTEYDDVIGIVHNESESTVSLILNMDEFEPEVNLRYLH